jgi:hypothetical protein
MAMGDYSYHAGEVYVTCYTPEEYWTPIEEGDAVTLCGSFRVRREDGSEIFGQAKGTADGPNQPVNVMARGIARFKTRKLLEARDLFQPLVTEEDGSVSGCGWEHINEIVTPKILGTNSASALTPYPTVTVLL